MKKLSLLLPLAILTACTTADNNSQVANNTEAPSTFACEDGGMINAKYDANGEKAFLQISIPKANISNVSMEMEQAVSGSGARYINNQTPNETYEWQTKGNDGIFTVTYQQSEPYTMVCQAS